MHDGPMPDTETSARPLRRLCLSSRRWLPLAILITVALVGLTVAVAPRQAVVGLYKLVLMLVGGVAAYGLDRTLWPYAAPSSYLDEDWRNEPDADRKGDADYRIVSEYKRIFCIAMIRQVALVACGMLAVCLGL